MATVTVLNVVSSQNFNSTSFRPDPTITKDIKVFSTNIRSVTYPQADLIEAIVPFRVSITNIGLGGYSRQNVPGIGIQIIGYSNYIL